MKKILVTGGSGFIGSYVVKSLLKKGFNVNSLVRKVGDSENKINLFYGNILDKDSVIEAVGHSDGVIHLAGVLGTSETMKRIENSVEVNVIGSLNLFNACHLHKKRAVYISVQNYWMNNPYAISKYTAERFALMYNKESGTKIAILRACNVYGPGQKMSPVKKIIPNFTISALTGEDITIYGSGNQVVDMIYVEDIAEILVRAIVLDHGIYNMIFEAGYGKGIKAIDIANIIIKKTGSSSKIKKIEMRPGEDPENRVVSDINTLKPLKIDQNSLIPLEKGLDITIEWYKKHMDDILRL